MYSIQTTEEIFQYYTKNTHDGDSGIDLFFIEDERIEANSMGNLIGLGIRCSLEIKGEPRSYIIMPRSSIYKTPLRMSNSQGLIDAGYRGELKVPIDNLSSETFHIKKGTSYFQLVAPDLRQCTVKLVSSLSETSRGEGGFGSTGNN